MSAGKSRGLDGFSRVVKKRLTSEAAAAASRDGRWRNQLRRAAHDGCCRRVAQIRALTSVLWAMLVGNCWMQGGTSQLQPSRQQSCTSLST
ncbi:hypothetical protein Taro_005736 [Colocasia esculenta]|uniref:Uncharacterized protein n=1 Tax=Colocasia esculenta TaxID=4460 RepID=A0A843TP25_COLES|nr:hypothetical protein [Colocasia esculenta]